MRVELWIKEKDKGVLEENVGVDSLTVGRIGSVKAQGHIVVWVEKVSKSLASKWPLSRVISEIVTKNGQNDRRSCYLS